MTTGYSNTPLAKKLSLRDGQRVWFHQMPDSVHDEIDEYALELTFVADPAEGVDAAHVLVTTRAELERLTASLRHQIEPAIGSAKVCTPGNHARHVCRIPHS